MLENYIASLKKLLSRYELSERERSRIITDTLSTIETLKTDYVNESDIIKDMPTIADFKQQLNNTYPLKDRLAIANLLNRLIFFGGILTFFIMGSVFSAWHPGWLIFVLMPILIAFVELLNDPDQPISSLLTVFGGLIVFGLLWLIFSLHPAWVALLLIPAGPLYNSKDAFNNKAILMSLFTPLITVPITVVIVSLEPMALPIVSFNALVLVPLHHIKKHPQAPLLDLALLTTIGLYVMLYYTLDNPAWALYAFGLYLFVSMAHKPLTGLSKALSTHRFYVLISLFYVTVLTLTLTIMTFFQALTVLFLWPVLFSLFNKPKGRWHQRITPLIIGAFYAIGVFLNAWHPGWLVLLLVPIVKTLGVRKHDG